MNSRDFTGHNFQDHVVTFDSEEMEVTTDVAPGIRIPVQFIPCPLCGGQGHYVDPGVDRNGLTAGDMEELGAGFMQAYFAGHFNVPCGDCHGDKFVLAPLKRKFLTEAQAQVVRQVAGAREDAYYHHRVRMAELGIR